MVRNYRDTQSRVYQSIDDHKSAIKDLTIAITAKPITAHYYRYRAKSYAALANFEDAIDDLHNAIDQLPNYREAQ